MKPQVTTAAEFAFFDCPFDFLNSRSQRPWILEDMKTTWMPADSHGTCFTSCVQEGLR